MSTTTQPIGRAELARLPWDRFWPAAAAQLVRGDLAPEQVAPLTRRCILATLSPILTRLATECGVSLDAMKPQANASEMAIGLASEIVAGRVQSSTLPFATRRLALDALVQRHHELTVEIQRRSA